MELINAHEKKGQSTILLLGHFSNWEGMLSIGYHLLGKGYVSMLHYPTNILTILFQNHAKNTSVFTFSF